MVGRGIERGSPRVVWQCGRGIEQAVGLDAVEQERDACGGDPAAGLQWGCLQPLVAVVRERRDRVLRPACRV